ncbi:ubiquitin protein ligase Sel1/Ubx2 [Zymoseptoria brevis]|uniref:Ubiquitin protein ligase Sel1/Ubx2 n=1 Tax=Zymoseptoria brevis TaxID=1047168 RepID=A0A0F4GEC5_9PEZI|nr:ubiquitin protein ligase Sel1/Ubx2 [Zymoseptoria brevis]
MKRPILPLLLVLCIFLAFTFARDDLDHITTEPAKLQESPLSSGSTPLEHSSESKVEEEDDSHEGPSVAVIEATALLRKIKPPTTSKLADLVKKPTGVIGTTVYYAKEAFVLLFMNAPNAGNLATTSATTQPPKLGQPLSKAVKLLEQAAADEEDRDAIFLLAEMNFHGNHTHPVNYDEAFKRYKQLADIDGNSTAQYMIGFMYATGLAPSVPSNQAKSMLYHTYAAETGNTRSQMTLAYRNLAGVAAPRNCDEAVHWYKQVADKAVLYYRSGPPGGHSLVRDAFRIADEDGGVYGEGASVASAGPNAKYGGPTSDAYASIEDVLEYLELESSKGDIKATFSLARLHYDGAKDLPVDFQLAKKYFMDVARQYWTSANKIRKDVPGVTEKYASKAAGYLGRMFLRGEGTQQSYKLAKTWFERGLKNGDALSQYSLGLMYLDGLGVEQNTMESAEYLSAAADQDLAVAQTKLGILFLDQGDTATATKYFELAARNSHIEAYYYLAEMAEKAIGRDRSCGQAAVYYKIVAEKAEPVWSSLAEAVDAYDAGDYQRAIIGYLMAAEQGSENAQANVAWLLDQTKPTWSPLSWFKSVQRNATNTIGDAALALVHWTRSAKQQNIDSLVKMGDYYLNGIGAPASPEHAAACYQAAVNTLQSAQAMWNLGWMHENGVGINQDFHLAKRFYDQAFETNPREAYFPVKISLFKLRWRSWWNGVTRGGVHGIEDEDKEKKRRSFAEWLNDFLEADAAYYDQYEADDWEDDHMPGGDAYYDDLEFEDGVLETLLIGGLIATLGFLLYYRGRQQRQLENRRWVDQQQQPGNAGGEQQQQQEAQQQDRGVFPEPGDPAVNDWLAGGLL